MFQEEGEIEIAFIRADDFVPRQKQGADRDPNSGLFLELTDQGRLDALARFYVATRDREPGSIHRAVDQYSAIPNQHASDTDSRMWRWQRR